MPSPVLNCTNLILSYLGIYQNGIEACILHPCLVAGQRRTRIRKKTVSGGNEVVVLRSSKRDTEAKARNAAALPTSPPRLPAISSNLYQMPSNEKAPVKLSLPLVHPLLASTMNDRQLKTTTGIPAGHLQRTSRGG